MGDAVSGFIKGFAAGWAMFPSQSEREYQAAKTRLLKAQAGKYEDDIGKPDTTAIKASHDMNISERRLQETIRHNKENEKNSLKPRATAESADLEVPESALADDGSLNPDVDPAGYEDVVTTHNKGGPVPAAIPSKPKGMRVQRFANGGGVVGEEEMVDEQPAVPLSQGAIPMAPGTQQLAPEVQQPPAPQMNQPTTAAEDAPGFSYMAAVDAAKAGLAGIAEEGGSEPEAKAIPSPGDKPKSKGTEPATVEQLNELNPIVDPPAPNKPKLSESQMNAKKLAWGYEHYLQKGDNKKAKEYAVSMVKTFEDLRNRFNTIAAAKADQGDVDGAIGAALRAYAYVPDGLEVKLQKTKDGRFAYQYKDNVTGKMVSKGLKTPEEMLAIVTRGAASSMDDLVARAADVRQKLAPDVAEGVIEGEMPESPVSLDEAKAIGGTKARREAAAAKAARYKDTDKNADKRAAEKASADEKKATAKVAADEKKAAAKAKADADKAAAKYPREAPAMVTTREAIVALPDGAHYASPDNPEEVYVKGQKAAAPAAVE
jgi:histone H1/5